jgi:hypothetical protein
VNGAFTTDAVAKKSSEFICVKASQKLANQYKVKGAPMIVIVDPDGVELNRATVKDEGTITAAYDQALSKYANQPISWSSEVSAGSSGKKLLIVGFDTEGDEGLKVLEDRMLVKYQEKISFVKLPYEKDGEVAKKWAVTSAPTLILCDASKENPEKSPIEKIQGKKTAGTLRLAILKALAKLESKK